jgi:membrane-bound acyltransferase YfiQ involved in biofilm formation
MSGYDRWFRYLLQPFKFGTIAFFLISGFLMQEGLTRRPPLEYLKRRLHRVFTPWLFWFALFFGMTLTNGAVHGQFLFHSLQGGAASVLDNLYQCLFASAYWFVPNLMIALCVLLLCRRFLLDIRLGGAFLALSLFYGLNIHWQWIPLESHTEAFFGFVFYLWLGAWAAQNFAVVEAWIERTPMVALCAFVALSALAALREADLLSMARVTDPMNSLRIGNQVYSVAVVLAICKLRKTVSPRAVNVRTSTFGIYLAHTIVMTLLIFAAKHTILRSADFDAWKEPAGVLAGLSLSAFLATYGCSLILTQRILDHPRLRWMVGAGARGKAAHKEDGTASRTGSGPVPAAAMFQELAQASSSSPGKIAATSARSWP